MNGAIPSVDKSPKRHIPVGCGVEENDSGLLHGHVGLGPLDFTFLGFFPQEVHFFERALIKALVLFLQLLLDIMEAPGEAVDRLRQDVLGFDIKKAREIDDREEQITQFFARARFVAGPHSVLELFDLLRDLVPNRFDFRPVEA